MAAAADRTPGPVANAMGAASGHAVADPQPPPTTGLVVLQTSPRVAPGLLSLAAWEVLRSASAVLSGSQDHPQVAALRRAGVPCQIAPAETAADRARRLVSLARDAAAPVVWLAAPSGDDDLMGEITGAGARAVRLRGSHDLPGSRVLDLVATMDTLRTGCPWDAKQSHRSLAPHLVEESYEALEALESGDPQAIRDELGDVLLQVVFHARIAAEREDGSGFTIDDVADTIVAKLTRRHPHVFGDVTVSGADEVKTNWTAIKAAERKEKYGGSGSVLDGVPFGQPALALAAQLQSRAAAAGAPPGLARQEKDLGGKLFALVAKARAAGLDPELELRAAAREFSERVRAWERSAHGG